MGSRVSGFCLKMKKRAKLDLVLSLSRQRSIQFLAVLGFLYIAMFALEAPFVLRNGFIAVKTEEFVNDALTKPIVLQSRRDLEEKKAPIRPLKNTQKAANQPSASKPFRRMTEYKTLSSLIFHGNSTKEGVSGIQKTAMEAFESGKKLWDMLESGKVEIKEEKATEKRNETCPHSISLTGSQFVKSGKIIVLPCGLTLGSHITIVGKPRKAHPEEKTKIALLKEGQYTMVSQFMMELQGLKAVDGEDPPRILHFNPRLKGDWSGRPVIEQNTCYRMQWGSGLRCEGWKSRADEETVDGQPKCEKWIRDDSDHSEESKAMWWLRRLTGRTNKVTVDWPFPFVEEKLFVLTLRAGLEGYHISVDGKHITSFPYHIGFTLEDATGLSLNGDVDVHSIYAASLPATHPSSSPEQFLQMSSLWQAPSLPEGPVELFIGILSAGNHFAERMAVRKSWMQHRLVKSSTVVGRFFVALHVRADVNVQLKKEAEFFGDIVIVPYMDNYDLVVLKTVAIAEYGVNTASAKYIMKGDDDTFINLDAVITEIKKVPEGQSFYIGNINYYHKPLRSGKWSVTYEEWPGQDYPPYANGPGYILTSDIANFIVSEFKEQKLRLFKMEDVSMGMWVEKFNNTRRVEYIHSLKYCQFGCIEGYYTAHYQSPRQMICLWDNLRIKGKAQCCNMR